jgi:hypothetical protein
MNRLPNVARPLPYLILPLAALLLTAAEPKRPEPVSPAASGAYDLEIKDGMLLRPGGKVKATLPNAVDALRDQYPEANIVLSPGLTNVMVSDLKLRAGSLAEELEGVRVASGEKFNVQPPAQSTFIEPTTGLAASPAGPDKGLFLLVPVPRPESERVVEAFNIWPYFLTLEQRSTTPEEREKAKAESLDRIYKIVNETIQALKQDRVTPEDNLTWRFHSGASLLVAVGRRDDVEVARKVVNALPGMPNKIDMPPAGGGAQFDEAFRRRYGLGPAPAMNPPPAAGPPSGAPAQR